MLTRKRWPAPSTGFRWVRPFNRDAAVPNTCLHSARLTRNPASTRRIDGSALTHSNSAGSGAASTADRRFDPVLEVVELERSGIDVAGDDGEEAKDHQRHDDEPRRVRLGERQRRARARARAHARRARRGHRACRACRVGVVVGMIAVHEVRGRATWLAEEGEVRRAGHVRGGHERADQPDDHEDARSGSDRRSR